MLRDLWPTYGLVIATPRLQLRLPDDGELVELAKLAGRGVHPLTERPFLTPWTEGGPGDRAQFVLREHWAALASWSADRWTLGLGVFTSNGDPLGVVNLRATRFAVVREVTTSSWLGLPYHGQGYGTEARLGLLELAFDHLDAEAALTEVFQNNHASQGVSRKLGYQPDGISRDARGSEVVVSDRLRLIRDRWLRLTRPTITVDGVDECRHMFVDGRRP